MKAEAQKNLEEIKIEDVIEKTRELNPGQFDKMIFDSAQSVKRANYLYVKYKTGSADRVLNRLEFPMHDPLKAPMQELIGGSSKHGEKAVMTSDKVIRLLQDNFSRSPIADSNPAADYFDYPLDVVDANNVAQEQQLYYMPNETEISSCGECTGEKYVICDDHVCGGVHNWECPTCAGDKKVECTGCNGEGENTCDDCDGGGMVKCGSTIGSSLVGGLTGSSVAGCGGKGYVMVSNGNFANGSPRPKKRKQCTKCRGDGEVRCKECAAKGVIKCSPCRGKGQVTCSECSGKGDITCSKCYGDKAKYGKIDCPTCEATGETGKVVYVATAISNNEKDLFVNIGESIAEISDDLVLNYIDKAGSVSRSLTNINDNFTEEKDELVANHVQDLRTNSGLEINSFAKVLTEDTYYQVVPVVQVSYKHMLTNEILDFSIVDFFEDPKLVFHKEAEEIKSDVKDKGKKLGRFFGKLFKTKKFKSKDDKKKEIKLMIYLAKADGKIEEEEKGFLAESINSIDEFTSDEKEDFFNLMNNPNPPAITKEDVIFSSKEKLNEVIAKLTGLAASDGEIDDSEQELLNTIMSLNE